MIHNDPVALPGLVALLIGLVAFVAALIAARRRRGREAAGPPASRSRTSLVGIVIQMLALLLIGAGPVRLILPVDAPLAIGEAIVVALLMTAAVALFVWASRAMGRNWSLVARTRGDHQLVRSGPFAHVRHPIYTGLALFALALAVAYGHLSHLWVAGPLYALGTWLRVREEERLLRARFGVEYDAYAARVGRSSRGDATLLGTSKRHSRQSTRRDRRAGCGGRAREIRSLAMDRPSTRTLVLRGSAALALSALSATAGAQNAAFDLAGPTLSVSVSRGTATLPLSAVPGLAVGDRVAIHMAAPADRGSRYSVVLAFLRGATSPPPADWLFEARPWDPKRASIDAAVPAGAEQALILLVPETGGAMKAVGGALRGRPGAFVRAVQELTQASLDRARLDAYLAVARAQEERGPAGAADATAALARNLAVKVDPACLARQAEVQAACLAQGGGAAVLADAQTTSLAQNLAGAPADVALAVSSTPQASFGYYSPYIGLVRDLARIFGAFQSAQLQFIPALEIQRAGETQFYLNTPPSFRRPQSVLVAPLPAIAPARPPTITPAGDGALCATRAPLLAGFTGAPLLYATGYARDVRLRVKLDGGDTLDLPATADPIGGGYLIATGADAGTLARATEGTLHGKWGFDPFQGPRYAIVSPVGASWRVADRASLVVGRDSPLPLMGGAASCLATVTLDDDGARKAVAWSTTGERGVTLKVPLDGVDPGNVALLLGSYGESDPQRLIVRAYSEPSRLSLFTIHLGERTGTLTGSRLDQVASLDFDGISWRPDGLGRVRSTDRLDMVADAAPAAVRAGEGQQAKVTLSDGRTSTVKVTVAPARAAATLLGHSVERVGPAPRIPIRVASPDILPADMRLTFSVRAPDGDSFSAGDMVEVAAGDQVASVRLPLRLQDAHVGIADLVPASALGPTGFGPARFRLVRDGIAGEWRPLGTVVRLPAIRAVRCGSADGRCLLEGDALYLLRSVAPTGPAGGAVSVPDGFTGDTIQIPRSPARQWRLALRDAPAAEASISAPD